MSQLIHYFSFIIINNVIIIIWIICNFQEFTNTGSLTNVGFTNALATEVSIFPPPGTEGTLRPDPVPIQVTDSEQPSRPAHFPSTIPDVSDWFGKWSMFVLFIFYNIYSFKMLLLEIKN